MFKRSEELGVARPDFTSHLVALDDDLELWFHSQKLPFLKNNTIRMLNTLNMTFSYTSFFLCLFFALSCIHCIHTVHTYTNSINCELWTSGMKGLCHTKITSIWEAESYIQHSMTLRVGVKTKINENFYHQIGCFP